MKNCQREQMLRKQSEKEGKRTEIAMGIDEKRHIKTRRRMGEKCNR